MTQPRVTAEQQRFMDDLAAMLSPWGMPPAGARLYAFLLLQDEPASLDQICAGLQISKSTASVTARNLEQSRLLRRHSERGSKRVLYGIAEGNSPVMHERAAMLGQLSTLLEKNSGHASGPQAAERLQKIARFCSAMQTLIQQAMHDLDTDWS